MQVNERRVNGITVFDLAGRLTVSDHPSPLKERVNALVARGEKNIILNLADLKYCDSSCLGELVAVYTTAVRVGGTMRLANTEPHVKKLLEITRLSCILESYDSEGAAIASLMIPA